jgi:alpha-tubulin suppressor-like RCC1 family protein
MMDSDDEEEEGKLKVQAADTAATVQIYARALGTNECARTGACRGALDALTCVEAWADGTIRDDAMRAMCGRDDWRGVEALGRERGASASSVDAESGWSATHACAHLGNLRSARALSSACGKTFDWEAPTDWRGRAPVDLVSEKVCAARVRRRGQRAAKDGCEDEDEDEADEETRFAYAWGSGANFSLGTGSTETERRPARVDALFKANVRECATNKVHGLAVDSDGEIWVWGCTRDGVLGLGRENREESTAVIFPTPLRGFGLASDVKIVKVSAGLAHSAATTSDGALYAWGYGKHGRLGYVVVDEDGRLDGLTDEEREERRFTQYRPKRVPNLAGVFITDVACGDSHTVALDARGSVWTMGSNARGQLGYFVPDRSNDGAKCGAAPNEPCCSTAKQVEYLKHRELVIECVSASRHHTLVSTATGDAYSFGHGSTSVRRVATPRHDFVSWHQVDPRIVKVSAGVEHSAAMTRDGWVYVWESASEHLQAKMLKGLPGGCAADVSCGANRCAVVNATGEVYTWETSSGRRVNAPFGASSGGGFALGGASPRSFGTSPRSLESPRMNAVDDVGDILLTRVRGLKGVERVFAGDAHFLAIQVITKPRFSLGRLDPLRKRRVVESELDKLIRDIGAVPASPLDALRGDVDEEEENRGRLNENQVDATKSFPSLVLLAQHAVANAYIEPRNALDVVQLADQINAVALKRYAMEYAIKNLDVVLLETPKNAFHEIDNQYLKELTKLMRSGEVVDGWSDDALQTRCEHVESLEEIKRASKTSSRRVKVIKNDEDAETPTSAAKPPLAKILAQSRDAPTAGRSLDDSPRASRSTTKTRGSLSMFLSGELEGKSPNANKWSSSPSATSPQSQASPDDEERLARQTQRLSLREIQSQQERASASAARMPPSTSVDAPPVFSPSPASPNAVSLGDLIRRKRGVGSSPAWNSPVASSPTGAPSNLRDILNAEAAEAARRETHSVTTGFNIPKSPGDRWYVPTEAPAVSLRDILDEESEARDDAEAAELAAALAAINAQETAEALELIAKSEEASSKDRRKRRSGGASSAAQKPRRGGGGKGKAPASAEPSTSTMKPNKDHRHGVKKPPPPPSNPPKDDDDDVVKSKAPSRRRRKSIQPNAECAQSVQSPSTARDSRHRRRTDTKNETKTKTTKTTNEE